MSEPKRYELVTVMKDFVLTDVRMEEASYGDWVKLEDYETLRTRLDAAEKRMATMVCGTCKGEGTVPLDTQPAIFAPAVTKPCPVCQPKEGT